MEYQLVIQFPATLIADFDVMVSLEETLISKFGDSADVDGHDFGSGEANIFIITSDPSHTFDQSKSILESREILNQCKVAYRKLDEDDYSVLWPIDHSGEFEIK